MRNVVIMRKIDVTTSYKSLSSQSDVASVTVSCPPSNAATVYFLGDDGSAVPWVPGEWHEFMSVDLSTLKIKGNVGDMVTIVGGTW